MKIISIETLLTWAFTRELCKGGADRGGSWVSSWAGLAEMAELGALVDRSPNGYGVIEDLSSDGVAHPDAIIIGDAVRGLARERFTVPEDDLFPEFDDPHGLIAAEAALARDSLARRGDNETGRHVVGLVINAAILGRGPDGTCEPPRFRMVEKYGKPAWFVTRRMRGISGEVYAYEDEGYDAAKGRPKPGAYRKWQLTEPLRGAAMTRIDRIWWREALGRVGEAVAGRLTAHRVVIGGGAEMCDLATVDSVAVNN